MKRVPSESAQSAKPALSDAVAWYSILVCVAFVPLAVAIIPGSPVSNAWLSEPYHLAKLMILSGCSMFATIAWIFEITTRRTWVRVGLTQAGLAVFCVAAAVSTALGIEPVGSLFGGTGLMTGTVTWLGFAWLGFLVTQYADSSSRLRELSWVLVAAAGASALVAVLQALGLDLLQTSHTAETQWMVKRGLSTLGNPDYTGLMMVAPAAVAAGLALSASRAKERYVAWVATSLIIAAAMVTLTRASWIGITVGAVMLSALIPARTGPGRRAWALIAVGATCVAAVSLLIAGPLNVLRRFSTMNGGLDGLTSGRLTLWSDTLQVIFDRPLFGTGADRLALGAYPVQTQVVTEGVNRFALQDPHNVVLLVTATFGLFAAAGLFTYAAWTLYSGWKIARVREGAGALLYSAWVAAGVSFLIASLMSVYTITAVFMLFLVLSVISIPLLRRANSPWGSYGLAVVGIALITLALFGSVQNVRASRLVSLSREGDSQARLEAAIRAVPWDTRTRLTYQWRKVGAYRPVIQGPDPLVARQALDMLDSEIAAQIVRTPAELLWYRMRVDLQRLAQGYPGYSVEAERAAIEGALQAFPADPEFTRWLQELDSGQSTP